MKKCLNGCPKDRSNHQKQTVMRQAVCWILRWNQTKPISLGNFKTKERDWIFIICCKALIMEIKDSFRLADLTQKPEEALKAIKFLPSASEHFRSSQKTHTLQFWIKLPWGRGSVSCFGLFLEGWGESCCGLVFALTATVSCWTLVIFVSDLMMSFGCSTAFYNDPVHPGFVHLFSLYVIKDLLRICGWSRDCADPRLPLKESSLGQSLLSAWQTSVSAVPCLRQLEFSPVIFCKYLL